MNQDDIDIDRRKLLAGLAGVGAAGVAGCTGGEDGDGEDEVEQPELTFDPNQLDEPLRFIVQSLHYQNQQV